MRTVGLRSPSTPMRQAALQSLQHLHDHGSVNGIEDQLMMFKERQIMVDAPHFNALSDRYGERTV